MKYLARPTEVDAFKIVEVGQANTLGEIPCALENGESMLATPAMLARYIPIAGDYWVIGLDGYNYLNPKAVFEKKYSPLSEDF